MLVDGDDLCLEPQAHDCPDGATQQQDVVALGRVMWSMITGRPFLAQRRVSTACLACSAGKLHQHMHGLVVVQRVPPCLTLLSAAQVPQLPMSTQQELPGLQAALELCLGGNSTSQDILAALRDVAQRTQELKEAAAAAAAAAEAAARAAQIRAEERAASFSAFCWNTLTMGAFMLR